MWNKYPSSTRCLVMFLWCAAGSSLGLGAMGCIANPTPHPAEEDQDYEMGASEGRAFGADRGASAEEAANAPTVSDADATGGPDVLTGDVIDDAVGDLVGDADDDALDDIGPGHGMADADAIIQDDSLFPDGWDDVEEDVSELDTDEPEAG